MNKFKKQLSEELEYFVKFWTGAEPLWIAYWIHFVLVGYGLSKIADIGVIKESVLYLSIYLILATIYYFWSAVSVWRCAFNTKRKVWGYIARIIVCVGPFWIIWLNIWN